jgi:hypothetical protein
MFDPALRVPFGYSTATRTLGQLEVWLLVHHHPEYVRRLLAVLSVKGGSIGVGGGWRGDGSQPDKPGFAPEGKSFHQNQKYADGFIGACAVDVVARNPGHVHRVVTWVEVPAQGSREAVVYGIHANVDQGARPEPWHWQPIEIDGWDTWIKTGSPAPHPNYPLPDNRPIPPPPKPPPPLEEDDPDVISYAEIMSTTTAPPVTEVVAGRADRWLNAALLRAALFDTTGSDEYDQPAANALNALLQRKD